MGDPAFLVVNDAKLCITRGKDKAPSGQTGRDNNIGRLPLRTRICKAPIHRPLPIDLKGTIAHRFR